MKTVVAGIDRVLLYTILTIFLAVAIGVAILNPLWDRLAIPGLFPSRILPPITAPVDGLYYILNAEMGYRWHTQDPLSIWFHPLLSFLLRLLPSWLSPNLWFWTVSVLFAAGCMPLVFRLATIVSGLDRLPAWLLPLCLVAPGGLGMATGNAELPTLFFVLALLLSVLVWRKSWLTASLAIAAVLTKPNSLYMVPVLLVYFAVGIERRDSSLWRQALVGLVALLVTWLLWVWLVDWETGQQGVYWEKRVLEKYYLGLGTGDVKGFFESLAKSFYYGDLRDQIRYSTALIIPLANFLVIGLIPLADESHRYAMAAGNLAMLAISLFLGNPNKIIVYTTTLPGYLAAHLLLVNAIITDSLMLPIRLPRLAVLAAYGFYCMAMMVVFAVGMPLRWYH